MSGGLFKGSFFPQTWYVPIFTIRLWLGKMLRAPQIQPNNQNATQTLLLWTKLRTLFLRISKALASCCWELPIIILANSLMNRNLFEPNAFGWSCTVMSSQSLDLSVEFIQWAMSCALITYNCYEI